MNSKNYKSKRFIHTSPILQSQGQTIWKAANKQTKNKSVQRICNEMHSMLLIRHYGGQKVGQRHFEIAGLGSGLRWPHRNILNSYPPTYTPHLQLYKEQFTLRKKTNNW